MAPLAERVEEESGGSPLPPMPDVRLRPSGAHGPAERREVIRPHLPLTIDKEGGGARYPAHVGALDVRRNAFAPSVVSKVLGEGVHVDTERFRIPNQILGGQRVLVLEQQVVHRPEGTLRSRRLGCLGRQLGILVNVR
jgi:hypothetical protein